MLKIWSTVTFILCFICAQSQTETKTAYTLGVEGILKVDNGEYKEGIKLLKQARNLEPTEYDYPFEIGKAYLKSGEPKKAEKYLFDLQYHANVQADLYILLSRCYSELEQLKKTPNPDNKRAMDALRYGIQKLPNDGVLYLELAQQNLKLLKSVEAIAVLETGIAKAPNFAENYFWAAKLMAAANNHLWAWIYAEVFYNMTDDLDLKRSAAIIISKSTGNVFSKNWQADPEKFDQDVAFALTQKCQSTGEVNFENKLKSRACLISNIKGNNLPVKDLFERTTLLISKGWFEAYLWSIMQESDKPLFLKWLPENAANFDAYRNWRYWNPIFVKTPIIRLNN